MEEVERKIMKAYCPTQEKVKEEVTAAPRAVTILKGGYHTRTAQAGID